MYRLQFSLRVCIGYNVRVCIGYNLRVCIGYNLYRLQFKSM